MPDEIDEFSVQSWNVPVTVLDLQCLQAGSSTQPVRIHGSFLARSDVPWFEVWRCVPVPQNEGGLTPRLPKWGCRIDWDISGHDHGVNSERRLQFCCVGEWEANEADPWAQALCGQISLCSWSAWPPHWERIATFVGQRLWLRRKCCCSSPRDLIRGNGPMSSWLPLWAIVGLIAAASTERSSFSLYCWHVGPSSVLDRKLLPDSLRRLRIWCYLAITNSCIANPPQIRGERYFINLFNYIIFTFILHEN